MNTSTGSTIRDGAIQHWDGKVPSLSNGKWLKRALGAALKRDRSSIWAAETPNIWFEVGKWRMDTITGKDFLVIEAERVQRENMANSQIVTSKKTSIYPVYNEDKYGQVTYDKIVKGKFEGVTGRFTTRQASSVKGWFEKTKEYVLTGTNIKPPKEAITPSGVVGGVVGGTALLALCTRSMLLCPISGPVLTSKVKYLLWPVLIAQGIHRVYLGRHPRVVHANGGSYYAPDLKLLGVGPICF